MVLLWMEATPALIKQSTGEACVFEDEEIVWCVLGKGCACWMLHLQQDEHWLACIFPPHAGQLAA